MGAQAQALNLDSCLAPAVKVVISASMNQVEQSGETADRPVQPKVHWQMSVQLPDGRVEVLHKLRSRTVGDLKAATCLKHGYDPDQHGLMNGARLLDDAL